MDQSTGPTGRVVRGDGGELLVEYRVSITEIFLMEKRSFVSVGNQTPTTGPSVGRL